MTTSSKTLLALTLSTMLAGPALAQQQSGPNQMGQQQFGQQNQQMGQQRRAPEQYRQEQGRVVQVRPARVRGVNTPNYLVVIETQPGRRIVADIGRNQQNRNLQQGTPIAVRGQIVRVGNQGALLLADAFRVNNQTYDVNRPAYRRTGTGGQQVGQSSESSRFQERAALRRQLRQAGFRNIRILDAAYLVQARTPDGRAVVMVIDPPPMSAPAATASTDRQNRSSGTPRGQQFGSGANSGEASDQNRLSAPLLDPGQVRTDLRSRGFSNISNLSRDGYTYTAMADWRGQQVQVRVDGRTGFILEPRPLTPGRVQGLRDN